MKNQFLYILLLSHVLLLAAACGPKNSDAGKVIKTVQVGSLTATLSSPSGQIKHGGDEFFLTFKDPSGKAVDAGSVGLVFHMPAMGTMQAMNDQATFTTTDTPGMYNGEANVEVAGEWQTQISYEGPAGKGQTSVPVNVQ